ncbi:gag-pol polyprotein [Tanacetum coccineum]|uniref:glyceraldehyde-3-phosphate dehydrogenase (phosphorylating) n=1 Tax=Tanacetum coccineum TaxID=301880 RepID=A0ABQ5H8L6_9ASTR
MRGLQSEPLILCLVHQPIRIHRIAKVELAVYEVGLRDSDGYKRVNGVKGKWKAGTNHAVGKVLQSINGKLIRISFCVLTVDVSVIDLTLRLEQKATYKQTKAAANSHQQSLADAGSETRPPMFERGSYVLWSSRFMRYINRTCKNAKDMRERVRRLMQGTDLSEQERHSRFMNKFDKFTFEAEESLTYVYECFSRLKNDMDQNKITPINMGVNTKFLNSLQPQWNKYVTNVCLTKKLKDDHYDVLFDHLHQYEVIVNVSRAKRVAKIHDPLALVANTYEHYSTPTNNRLRTYSNTKNQAIVKADRVDIQSKNVEWPRILRTTTNSKNGPNVQCYNCNAKGHYARDCPKPRVRNSKYFQEQMLLAKKDEAC